MFLKCGSYEKQVSNKQEIFNPVDKSSSPTPDQFVFSDFFIRKHPKVIEFKNANPKTQRPNDKHQHHFSSQKDDSEKNKQKNGKEITVFALPKKTGFQIKFPLHKSRKNSSLNSVFQRQISHNFQDKRELIRHRKIGTNLTYTPRPSVRYFHPSNNEDHNLSQMRLDEKRQRKSIEISSNFIQSPNTFQKGQISLTNAYKVKSLVLGKNPKQESSSKSKQFMSSMSDNKKSNTKISFLEANKQKSSDKNAVSPPQTSRVSTQYRNHNADNVRFRFSVKQNSRKSVKLKSNFQNSDKELRLQEINLEPWTKVNEIDNVYDVRQIDIDFNEENNKIEFAHLQMTDVDLKPMERRNFSRKIFYPKQNKQQASLKATIFSQK